MRKRRLAFAAPFVITTACHHGPAPQTTDDDDDEEQVVDHASSTTVESESRPIPDAKPAPRWLKEMVATLPPLSSDCTIA